MQIGDIKKYYKTILHHNSSFMKLQYFYARKLKVFLFILASFFGFNHQLISQATNKTLASGAYIINMGVVPQTYANGLFPYGLVYDLVKNHGVQVDWVIRDGKLMDEYDFIYNGVEYKGGPFIIPAEFRSGAVNTVISNWEGDGVVGVTTTSPITVPVAVTLKSAPLWTINAQNGGIAEDFLSNANIPPSAFNSKDPQDLDCCDDIFAMPHADPEWGTHSNLYGWNLNCNGAIWMACHAGSALENMFNPGTPAEQTNFLSQKTGIATGGGPYVDPGNSIILWGDHDDGTLPYSYQHPSDPFMQFIGIIDGATENGSEQIYIPVNGGGWNPGAKVYVYDPDHPEASGMGLDMVGASVVSGRGFDDPDRGRVMLESSHDVGKKSLPANVAAQRIFFNFSFFTANEKAVIPDVSGAIPDNLFSGVPTSMSFSLPAGVDPNDYTIQWTSSCGGSFAPDNAQTVTFTPPTVVSATACFISISITDMCGRTFTEKKEVNVSCNMTVNGTATPPSCNGFADGQITLAVTNGQTPYAYNWSLQGGGTGSGTGSTITGLAAGTYDITVTENNGTGCSGTLTVAVSQPAALSASSSVTDVLCNGASTGAIDLTVSGGTAAYMFDWGGGVTTEDRSNISAGSYSVLITDANGCTLTEPVTVGEPAAISITPSVTDVLCFGESTGAINLTVSGGAGAMSYLWNDGNTAQNRSGLAAGTYSVSVTDQNACVQTANITVGQPTSALDATGVVTGVQCSGAATGAITLTPSGGTPPYASFTWSNGASTQNLSNLSAGNYTVTITDDNGCTVVKSFIVNDVSPLQLSVTITDATCPSDADGAIDLSVSGGAPMYTYDWDNNGLQDPDTDPQDLSGLLPNIYTVIVTDQNGCTATISATVGFQNPDPTTPAVINH